MRVDLVDRGPRSTLRDPTRPLAAALAAAGHRVRLYSTAPVEPAPAGVEVVRLAVRDGISAKGRPAVAKALGSLLDPASAATVVPFEYAGLRGAPAKGVLVSLPPLDAPPIERASGSWLERILGGRSARKEEAQAVGRSRWLLAPGDDERQRLVGSFPAVAARVPVVPLPVPHAPASPDRATARRQLRLPDDVPVVAYLGPPAGGSPAVRTAREAFQRARVFFPGARLLLPGVTAPPEPGAHAVPDPTGQLRGVAARAADLLLAPSLHDPGELLAWMRAGIPAVVGPDARFPTPPPKGAVRNPETNDSGAMASDLAELLADPGLARRIGEAGRAFADTYAPEAIVARFTALAS